MSEKKLIERPPRIQPDLPHDQIEIPPPPSEAEAKPKPIIQLFLPMVMIIGYLAMALFGGNARRLLIMLPMGLSMFASIGFALYSRSQDKKNEGKAQAAYQEILVGKREEMKNSHDIQRRFYRHNYPDIKERYYVAKYASARATGSNAIDNNSVDSKIAMRLWERRSTDVDFGEVRVGMGTRPSTVLYVSPGQGDFESPLMRDALRLAEDSRYVHDVPISITLRPSDSKERSDGGGDAKFSIGITGNDINGIYAFAHAFIWNYTTFHAPTEAKVIVLGTEERQAKWHWITALPHNGGTCFESPADREGDRDSNRLVLFTKTLRSSYEERERRLRDPDFKGDVSLPLNLVIVDLLHLPEESQLKTIDSDAAISLIMRKGSQVGGAVLFLVPHAHDVPSGCQAVMELTQPPRTESGNRPMQFRYAEVGVNTPRYTGRADRIYKQQALHDFANFLNPLTVPQTYGGGIPNAVLTFNMLGIGDANHLRQRLHENWTQSMLPPQKREMNGKKVGYEKDYSGWIQNTLGMTSDGGYRTLRYSADADGVHGLIAGSTGSGKSELLMSMILDMAFKYDPSIINFVLVDFKGGGAFKPLANNDMRLPHIVDVVTNLGASAVERMFAAITAELNRRQAINTNTDSKHIVEYRKNKLHLPDENGEFGNTVTVRGKEQTTAPYPHLFVIIDEFAEMIASNPEYKAQLNSITRLGRALGVTLILAAQRPTGVTDQMRANIKFRIALRVETREESNEILRQPDAAYLPTGVPGRGYLQVGNENIEMIQVAWSGSDYEGEKIEVAEDKRPVLWPDRQKRDTNAHEEEGQKIFELMVETMENVSQEISLQQRKPWPDFLPESMTLQHKVDLYEDYWTVEGRKLLVPPNLPSGRTHAPIGWEIDRWITDKEGWDNLDWGEGGNAMRAIVGLTDDPYNAKQHPLVIDFQRGHAVVFGASGWGKTTFLRTLVASLAATHTPNDLHVHVLDFGGQQLSALEDFPHVGSIIIPDEEERVRRSMAEMNRILQERKSLFADAKVSGLYAFNARYPDRKLPAILLIIDNFAAFRESFDELLPDLTALVRESRASGIHFVVSAELPNLLSGKLYSLFSERVALKLSDASEYTGIVGRGARDIEDIPGRGYVKLDRRASMCQVAMATGNPATDKQFDEIKEIADLALNMTQWLNDHPDSVNREMLPEPIKELDSRVRLTELVENEQENKPKRGVLPIMGIDGRTLDPWRLDIAKQGPHFEILGPSGSGKTTVLRTLALSLANSYTPDEVMIVLVDTRKRLFSYKGQRSLADLPHVVEAVSEENQLGDLPLKLKAEMDNPAREDKPIFVLIDNYDSFSEDIDALKLPDKRKALEELAKLARERGQDGLHFFMAMSMRARNDALRKQTKSCRYGIGMKDAEAAMNLEGKVPRYLQRTELPDGRGFVVKSGRTHRVQIATPYQERSDDNIEHDLDSWVTKITNRSYHSRNEWIYQPEMDDEESEDDQADKNSNRQQRSSTAKKPATKATSINTRTNFIKKAAAKINIDELKQKMSDATFLPPSFYDHHTSEQLINEAIERGLIEDPNAKKEA